MEEEQYQVHLTLDELVAEITRLKSEQAKKELEIDKLREEMKAFERESESLELQFIKDKYNITKEMYFKNGIEELLCINYIYPHLGDKKDFGESSVGFRNYSNKNGDKSMDLDELMKRLDTGKLVRAKEDDWRLPGTFVLKGIKFLKSEGNTNFYVGQMTKGRFMVFKKEGFKIEEKQFEDKTYKWKIECYTYGRRLIKCKKIDDDKRIYHRKEEWSVKLVKVCHTKGECMEYVI
jgi:hypothetical protein